MSGGQSGAAWPVAEHELRAGIAQDEIDGLARKLEVHRHRDQARAHDAEIGREILGAIGGEDGDAIAAREPARGERARDAVRHGVELGIAEFARRLLAAEIDDRDLAGIAIAADEVAEVGEGGHQPSTMSRMRYSLRTCTDYAFGGAVK